MKNNEKWGVKMFEKYIINDTHFRNYYKGGKARGFILCLRIHYYRGIPLSMIHNIKVDIDGEVFGTKDMRVILGGKAYTFEEMKEISDINWPFGQDLRLEIKKEGGLIPGRKTVKAELTCRNAYFGIFTGKCERIMTFG